MNGIVSRSGYELSDGVGSVVCIFMNRPLIVNPSQQFVFEVVVLPDCLHELLQPVPLFFQILQLALVPVLVMLIEHWWLLQSALRPSVKGGSRGYHLRARGNHLLGRLRVRPSNAFNNSTVILKREGGVRNRNSFWNTGRCCEHVAKWQQHLFVCE